MSLQAILQEDNTISRGLFALGFNKIGRWELGPLAPEAEWLHIAKHTPIGLHVDTRVYRRRFQIERILKQYPHFAD